MSESVKRYWLPIIFAAGVAWGTAILTLQGKVDNATYARDQQQRAMRDSLLIHEMTEVNDRLGHLTRYLCQGHERELGCQP